MKQKVSWQMALVAAAVLVALLVVLYQRSGVSGGGGARISPGFQQLSPEEQRQALEGAARARLRRGAPATGP
jgi:hypothetical protein